MLMTIKGYATLGAFRGRSRLIALQRAAPYWASQLNRRLKGASEEHRAIVRAIGLREGDAAYRLFFEHVVSAMNYSPISVAALNAATNDYGLAFLNMSEFGKCLF
jgi:DNA-binding GntR family transcriptional regulator